MKILKFEKKAEELGYGIKYENDIKHTFNVDDDFDIDTVYAFIKVENETGILNHFKIKEVNGNMTLLPYDIIRQTVITLKYPEA